MKLALIIIVAFLLQGCEKMSLQKSFDFDENDHPPIRPPFKTTVFEFMTTQADFSLMVEAVKRAGLESIYSGGADDKTVLLLRNDAMNLFLKDYAHANVAAVPVARLQNMLNYHVITTRLTQNDLPVQEYQTYQTLVPGPNGRITIYKWREYWEIRINAGGPDLPSTRKTANVYLHNYEFTNGVGHQLKAYVQWVRF